MLSTLWNLVIFVFSLSILITAHELGHFWIARYYSVTIKSFSIGFGKTLWKKTDRHGTDFIIALIPLGGYIKMLDKRTELLAADMRNNAFNNKTISQRAAIIIAGSISNFIFAIFAYWLAFIIGVPYVRPVVGEVIPNSIAANAQIKSGMEFKAIDGIETTDWDAIRLQLSAKIGDSNTTVSVISFDNNQKQDKVLDLRCWRFEQNKEDPILSLGIRPLGAQIDAVLSEVQVGSAASKAGLQPGDRIIKVNGQPLKQWITFVNLVHNNPGRPLILEVERQDSQLSFVLIPDTKFDNEKLKGFAGMAPTIVPISDKYKMLHQYGPFNAIFKATVKIWQLIKITLQILNKLIIGNIKLNNLSGPISIAQGAGISAKLGIVYYLMFLALISVNLGIINLFPIPTLDGGHLLFLALEKLKVELVSERIQNISYRIGSILLLLLMGLALFNDFSRLCF